MRHLIIISLLSVLLYSCDDSNSNDDNVSTESITRYDLDLITGISCVDNQDNPINSFGNPNNKIRLNSTETTESGNESGILTVTGRIQVYPIPYRDIFFISSNVEINEVWIVPSKAGNTFRLTDFESLFVDHSIDTTNINHKASYHCNQQDAKTLAINTLDLESGFYRVIIRTESELVWIATYKDSYSELDDIFAVFNEIW